jgi:hypothetical protein
VRRLTSTAVILAVALTAGACGGVGSIATARPGTVRGLLHAVEKNDDDETRFSGLAAHSDGTVYLGVVNGPYQDTDDRILALRTGRRPKLVLRVKGDGDLDGIDRLEMSAMAVAENGELFVAGYTSSAIVVLGLMPDGRKRVIQGPPTNRDELGLGRRRVVAMAVDPRNGDIYLADRCSVFRAPGGTNFAVVAGGAQYMDCNRFNTPAAPILQSFSEISGIAIDPRNGALYVSDGRVQVFRIEGTTVTAVAGRSYTDLDPRHRGFSGDGGPATEARLSSPGRLAVDPSNGDLYICDRDNDRLRKVDATGTITTAAGNGTFEGPTFNGPATEVPIDATQVAIDGRGRLYITGGLGSKSEGESVRLVSTTVRRDRGAP